MNIKLKNTELKDHFVIIRYKGKEKWIEMCINNIVVGKCLTDQILVTKVLFDKNKEFFESLVELSKGMDSVKYKKIKKKDLGNIYTLNIEKPKFNVEDYFYIIPRIYTKRFLDYLNGKSEFILTEWSK